MIESREKQDIIMPDLAVPATFRSILFQDAEGWQEHETAQAPSCFADLILDQIVDAITVGRQEYNLKPFFNTPLQNVEAIKYRQEVMRDLENDDLSEKLTQFAQKMRAMRRHIAEAGRLHYQRQKDRWFLEAVEIYCDAIRALAQDIAVVPLNSHGLLAFRDYLRSYVQSERFASLLMETKGLLNDLSGIRYCMIIKGSTIKVRKYEGEADYSAAVEETFEKFKQGAVKDYRAKFNDWPEMNHVEEKVLDFVAQLYPDIFEHLEDYCARNSSYVDPTIEAFDREIQFYLAYLEHIAPIKRTGLNFCYPGVSETSKQVHAHQTFDLALADKLVAAKSPVVTNDFCLEGPERIIVVTGPNQGGKTTFARTFGQLHYLASLGCPVPGTEARLFLFDKLLTHFEKEEHIENLRGKLEDDLVRIQEVLNQMTTNSIVIMNEIFTSTTLEDALFLGKEIMQRIVESDALCVCVTFMDELAALSEKCVSMVSTVVPENPSQRTFKIVRRPADGLAYALSIAEKYRLTYGQLRERIKE